jgi:hypothetical protein
MQQFAMYATLASFTSIAEFEPERLIEKNLIRSRLKSSTQKLNRSTRTALSATLSHDVARLAFDVARLGFRLHKHDDLCEG